MCGIFVSLGLEPDPSRIDIVAHRGPDGRGWRVIATPSGPLALGHRRLAIIDTSDAGLQPLDDVSGRYSIMLNGEVYNFLELRSELEAEGCSFRTATDTEVLLQALIRWGEPALHRLVGMFAFILWNRDTQTLIAARDRFGIKPLYVAEGPGWAALASEIKQLCGLPGATGRPNAARLRDFLAGGISDHTSDTMFDGIRQLRGGEILVLKAGGDSPELSIRRWHRPEMPSPLSLPRADAAQQFRELFDQSIRLHLRSDVSVGSCLSGGLDSSSIVAAASAAIGSSEDRERFVTISAVYPGMVVDEGRYADAVARHTGVRGVSLTPNPADLLDNLSSIVRTQDEPFGSTSILSQWAVFRAARREGVKVMLDGQGADEVLAGYAWMSGFRMMELARSGHFVALARLIRTRADLARLAVRFLPRSHASEGAWLRDRTTETPVGESLAEQRFLMTYATNLPMLLHWEDRNSMAHSIEARVPFLDHRLVDFGLSLGTDALFDGPLTKVVLRDAMRDRLPPAVSDRRDKLGFATPEVDWLRGALRPAVEEGVEEAIQRFPDLLEPLATRAFRDGRLNSPGPMDSTLWRIASAGLWGREFRIAL
jgi:asparagine synthase (glutamine-hydrolysing)